MINKPRTYQEAIDYLNIVRNYCFVCFSTTPDEDLPDVIPIARAYFDALPDAADKFAFESIMIDVENPDWKYVEEKVNVLLEEASYSPSKTFILLDMKNSIGNQEVTERIYGLFHRVIDDRINNFLLPPCVYQVQ